MKKDRTGTVVIPGIRIVVAAQKRPVRTGVVGHVEMENPSKAEPGHHRRVEPTYGAVAIHVGLDHLSGIAG